MDESSVAFSSGLPGGEPGEIYFNQKQSSTFPGIDRSSGLPHGDTHQDSSTTVATASAAERLKLSVTALITGRDTSAADHSAVIDGDEARAQTLERHPEGLGEKQLFKNCNGVTVLDGGGGTKGWGTEGLLSIKSSRTTRVLGTHLGLPKPAWVENGGSASAQQQCPYVAMEGAVTDSPIAGMDTQYRAEHLAKVSVFARTECVHTTASATATTIGVARSDLLALVLLCLLLCGLLALLALAFVVGAVFCARTAACKEKVRTCCSKIQKLNVYVP